MFDLSERILIYLAWYILLHLGGLAPQLHVTGLNVDEVGLVVTTNCPFSVAAGQRTSFFGHEKLVFQSHTFPSIDD